MNTRFCYVYRQSDKPSTAWKQVVFSGLCSAETEEAIRRALHRRKFFIAHQVRLPEIFPYVAAGNFNDELDSCWHFFDDLEPTSQPATDPYKRSIDELAEEILAASTQNWECFDPVRRYPEAKNAFDEVGEDPGLDDYLATLTELQQAPIVPAASR